MTVGVKGRWEEESTKWQIHYVGKSWKWIKGQDLLQFVGAICMVLVEMLGKWRFAKIVQLQ